MPKAQGTAKAKTDAPADNHGDVEILFVKSVPKTFRRCGFRFDRDGSGIAIDALTKEQIEILKNDPNLVVTRGTATDKAE